MVTPCTLAAVILSLATCAPLPCLSRDGDPVTVTAASPSPVARPSADPPRRTGVSGVATWFRSPAGVAAAGPVLRRLAGPGWRGRTVIVRSGRRSVTVRLLDWCACGPRQGRPTLIDLPAVDFAWLAPRSRGVIAVTVEVLQ